MKDSEHKVKIDRSTGNRGIMRYGSSKEGIQLNFLA